MKTRSHFAVRGTAAALAALSLTFAGGVAAQADNSNAIIEAAPSGGVITYYDRTPTTHYYVVPGDAYAQQRYADDQARQRALEMQYNYPPGSLRPVNPAYVDPVTGVVVAPGYDGPRDPSK